MTSEVVHPQENFVDRLTTWGIVKAPLSRYSPDFVRMIDTLEKALKRVSAQHHLDLDGKHVLHTFSQSMFNKEPYELNSKQRCKLLALCTAFLMVSEPMGTENNPSKK